MLETAQKSISRAGLEKRITVALADATQFDPGALFGVPRFDRVIISYALSMIPDWERVLEAGTTLLAASGSLHVVDFGDQAELPGWFRSGLHAWLQLFSVTPREDLPAQMAKIASAHGCTASARKLYRGYAMVAELRVH